MKKLTSILLIFLLGLSCFLASCDTSEETVGDSDSSATTEESKPWYSTSVPDDYSNTIIDNSSKPTQENSDTESSDTESSDTDVSTPSGDITYDDLYKMDRYDFAKAAKGYSIVYTKTSPLQAVECLTSVSGGITAIYDGTVTRFFDAVNGAYYHALHGRYEPCDLNYMDLNPGEFVDGDYEQIIRFTRTSENNVTFDLDEFVIPAHDFSYEAVYSEADKKVYVIDLDLSGIKGQMPCRLYTAEKSPLDNFDGTDAPDIDESKLGKYGVASDEKIIIPFEYDFITTTQTEGQPLGVYLAIKDGRSYYISSNGTVLTPDGFDCGSQPFNDCAWVFEDGQGYIIKFN